jgi:DNA-directed RNA polymerase I subunit RPA2
MGKQTMGTPATALSHRTDNKLYRLQTGQSPIVRPDLHNLYGMDHFPNGTNAIVAVISYTGYDMEDAMILNKSAHERGFGHGTIYKSQVVDLKDIRGASRSTSTPTLHFGFGPGRIQGRSKGSSDLREFLDEDGLPCVGIKLGPGDPLCAHVDDTTGVTHITKYKGDEVAYVDQVRLLGTSDLLLHKLFQHQRPTCT